MHRGFLPFNVSNSVAVDETWLTNLMDGSGICALIVQQFTKKIKLVAAQEPGDQPSFAEGLLTEAERARFGSKPRPLPITEQT
jgi:hypothetical protein